VPLNAHIDFSGNAWECNPGFELLEGDCVQRSGNALNALESVPRADEGLGGLDTPES